MADFQFAMSDPKYYLKNDQIVQNIPELHGIDNFASVIKQNSQQILAALSNAEKEKLYQALPEGGVKDKEKFLASLLKGGKN